MSVDLAASLEQIVLRATLPIADVVATASAAATSGVSAVVVFPVHVAAVRAALPRGAVRLCAAVGVPFSADGPTALRAGVERAVSDGADIVEVMLPLSLLREPASVVAGCFRAASAPLHSGGRSIEARAILETGYVDEATALALAQALAGAGCDAVVVASGFGPSGATPELVRTLRRALPPDLVLKAQGAVRSLADVERLRAAGAARVGVGDTASVLAEAAESP